MRTKKILFYSHDTFGLGHIRRTQKIANSIAAVDRSILIACASPKASAFASRPGIEYLNLPGFTKQVTGEYVPRSLNIPIDAFVNLRSHLLLSAVRSFAPDIVIIDKEPLGVKKELLPSLEHLRRFQKSCHIVCGFRDILDDKQTVQNEWDRRDTLRALQQYFDSVLIYGEKDIFDFAREYDLPSEIAQRLHYTGYIPPDEAVRDEDDVDFSFNNDAPLVTFTLGGGGDGWGFLETFINVIEGLPTPAPFNTVILTGPFASPALIARSRELAEKRPDVKAAAFTANALGLFKRSDLVVSMGGYNTFSELVSLGKRPLILPRVKPRQEQLIRAQFFKERGLCDYIHPDEITGDHLLAKMQEMIQSARATPPPVFIASGLERIRSHIEEILR